MTLRSAPSGLVGRACLAAVVATLVAALVAGCADDPSSLKIAIATPDADQEIGVGSTVEFEASVKGGEAPVSLTWNFDSTGVGGADPETSQETSPGAVTFGEVGEYVVTVEAEDDALQTATATVGVNASYEKFVSAFKATSGNEKVTLTWSAPSHPDYRNYLVRRDTAGYPEETTDGVPVEPGDPDEDPASPLVDETVDNDTEYFYTIFAYNDDDEFGKGIQAKVTPADKTAPSQIQDFTITGVADLTFTLTWTNPSGGDDDDDYSGIIIQYSDSGYPFSADDGDPGCDEAWDPDAPTPTTCDVTVSEYETQYYFSAFAYDDATEVNYSKRVKATDETGAEP
jgi:hypothetical protein